MADCLIHAPMLVSLVDDELACDFCDKQYRIADSEESMMIRLFDAFDDNGPINIWNGLIAIPLDYNLEVK